jgi:large repetitive protein
VPGYSVPSFENWNNDGLKDLIIGEGGGPSSAPGKVRVYLNVGTEAQPQFKDYFYAKSKGADLVCTPMACLGCYPRLVKWNGRGGKDLLVGQTDGTVRIFSNTAGPNDMPTFDGGPKITVGSGRAADLNVGPRATPSLVDWNNDGLPDLLAGTIDGSIHLYLNSASPAGGPPVLSKSTPAGQLVQENGRNLVVPSQRSSPVVADLDGDGKKDILTGDTDGHLLFYRNVGTDAAPAFSGSSALTSKGAPIQIGAGTRSRPFVCRWDGNDSWDILVGAGDGKVRLYRGAGGKNPEPGGEGSAVQRR